jgi:hypothetical protein
MSRALPGQCRGDVAGYRRAPTSERRATARDAEAGRDERPRPAQTVRAAGRPCASVPADRVACAFGFSAYGPTRRRRPVRSDRLGAERPDAVAGPQSVKPAPCGDGVSAESPTTRLTRQRRRPHRDCAGPSSLSPRRCPIRPRRRWPPSARADKSSVAPDDQARAAQMGRIAALAATRRRTAHTLS